MKVGTDAVLLGSWAPVGQLDKVLDIGTGSGVIALMLAQKGGQQIDAIDINLDAAKQAERNFHSSPWLKKLKAFHLPLNEYLSKARTKYDLIVSNPPYFESTSFTDEARLQARSKEFLSLSSLIESSEQLLEQTGSLIIILPFQYFNEVVGLATNAKFHLNRYCEIKGNKYAPTKRCIFQFSLTKQKLLADSIIIEEGGRHHYSKAYQNLLQDYLTIF